MVVLTFQLLLDCEFFFFLFLSFLSCFLSFIFSLSVSTVCFRRIFRSSPQSHPGLINFILIPFGNRVYHLPKSVSFNEKRPRKPETDIQKRFEDMKSELPPESFQPGRPGK